MAVMTDQGASVIAKLKERAARDGLQLQLLSTDSITEFG